MLSTPITCGASSSSFRRLSSSIAVSLTPCSTSSTLVRSALVGTGMSITARAQSLDRFIVLTIWPLGMVNTSPSVDRSLVTRSVTSSTVPSAGAAMPATVSATRSPKPYCFSVMTKKPASRSCTMRCAPKPSAAPSTAAGATSDPTGMASTSVISTSDHHEEHRDRHPGDDRCDRLPVLGALGAHQLIGFLEVRVDAAGDLLRGPVDEPGSQHREDDQQGDLQTPRDDPLADAAAPEVVPALRDQSIATYVLVVIFPIAPTDSRFQESVDVAVEYRGRIADLVVVAQVLDHLVRVQDVGAHLVAPRTAAVALQRVHLGAFF